jgi:hypothetical protein
MQLPSVIEKGRTPLTPHHLSAATPNTLVLCIDQITVGSKENEVYQATALRRAVTSQKSEAEFIAKRWLTVRCQLAYLLWIHDTVYAG